MAFTFSHPALIVPIYKKYPTKFSIMGLVMGSLVPDVPDFINLSFMKYIPVVKKLKIYNYWSIGTFIFFYLPCSIILAYLFDRLIKNVLILNLPNKIQSRLLGVFYYKFKLNSLKKIFVYIYSLGIGVISHAIWDDFTHPGTFIAQKINILRFKVYSLDLSTGLYLITSIVGIYILIYIFCKMRVKYIPNKLLVYSKTKKSIYWLIIIVSGVVNCIYKLKYISNFFKSHILLHNISIWIGIARKCIIEFISAGSIALILLSIVISMLIKMKLLYFHSKE